MLNKVFTGHGIIAGLRKCILSNGGKYKLGVVSFEDQDLPVGSHNTTPLG